MMATTLVDAVSNGTRTKTRTYMDTTTVPETDTAPVSETKTKVATNTKTPLASDTGELTHSNVSSRSRSLNETESQRLTHSHDITQTNVSTATDSLPATRTRTFSRTKLPTSTKTEVATDTGSASRTKNATSSQELTSSDSYVATDSASASITRDQSSSNTQSAPTRSDSDTILLSGTDTISLMNTSTMTMSNSSEISATESRNTATATEVATNTSELTGTDSLSLSASESLSRASASPSRSENGTDTAVPTRSGSRSESSSVTESPSSTATLTPSVSYGVPTYGVNCTAADFALGLKNLVATTRPVASSSNKTQQQQHWRLPICTRADRVAPSWCWELQCKSDGTRLDAVPLRATGYNAESIVTADTPAWSFLSANSSVRICDPTTNDTGVLSVASKFWMGSLDRRNDLDANPLVCGTVAHASVNMFLSHCAFVPRTDSFGDAVVVNKNTVDDTAGAVIASATPAFAGAQSIRSSFIAAFVQYNVSTRSTSTSTTPIKRDLVPVARAMWLYSPSTSSSSANTNGSLDLWNLQEQTDSNQQQQALLTFTRSQPEVSALPFFLRDANNHPNPLSCPVLFGWRVVVASPLQQFPDSNTFMWAVVGVRHRTQRDGEVALLACRYSAVLGQRCATLFLRPLRGSNNTDTFELFLENVAPGSQPAPPPPTTTTTTTASTTTPAPSTTTATAATTTTQAANNNTSTTPEQLLAEPPAVPAQTVADVQQQEAATTTSAAPPPTTTPALTAIAITLVSMNHGVARFRFNTLAELNNFVADNSNVPGGSSGYAACNTNKNHQQQKPLFPQTGAPPTPIAVNYFTLWENWGVSGTFGGLMFPRNDTRSAPFVLHNSGALTGNTTEASADVPASFLFPLGHVVVMFNNDTLAFKRTDTGVRVGEIRFLDIASSGITGVLFHETSSDGHILQVLLQIGPGQFLWVGVSGNFPAAIYGHAPLEAQLFFRRCLYYDPDGTLAHTTIGDLINFVAFRSPSNVESTLTPFVARLAFDAFVVFRSPQLFGPPGSTVIRVLLVRFTVGRDPILLRMSPLFSSAVSAMPRRNQQLGIYPAQAAVVFDNELIDGQSIEAVSSSAQVPNKQQAIQDAVDASQVCNAIACESLDSSSLIGCVSRRKMTVSNVSSRSEVCETTQALPAECFVDDDQQGAAGNNATTMTSRVTMTLHSLVEGSRFLLACSYLSATTTSTLSWTAELVLVVIDPFTCNTLVSRHISLPYVPPPSASGNNNINPPNNASSSSSSTSSSLLLAIGQGANFHRLASNRIAVSIHHATAIIAFSPGPDINSTMQVLPLTAPLVSARTTPLGATASRATTLLLRDGTLATAQYNNKTQKVQIAQVPVPSSFIGIGMLPTALLAGALCQLPPEWLPYTTAATLGFSRDDSTLIAAGYATVFVQCGTPQFSDNIATCGMRVADKLHLFENATDRVVSMDCMAWAARLLVLSDIDRVVSKTAPSATTTTTTAAPPKERTATVVKDAANVSTTTTSSAATTTTVAPNTPTTTVVTVQRFVNIDGFHFTMPGLFVADDDSDSSASEIQTARVVQIFNSTLNDERTEIPCFTVKFPSTSDSHSSSGLWEHGRGAVTMLHPQYFLSADQFLLVLPGGELSAVGADDGKERWRSVPIFKLPQHESCWADFVQANATIRGSRQDFKSTLHPRITRQLSGATPWSSVGGGGETFRVPPLYTFQADPAVAHTVSFFSDTQNAVMSAELKTCGLLVKLPSAAKSYSFALVEAPQPKLLTNNSSAASSNNNNNAETRFYYGQAFATSWIVNTSIDNSYEASENITAIVPLSLVAVQPAAVYLPTTFALVQKDVPESVRAAFASVLFSLWLLFDTSKVLWSSARPFEIWTGVSIYTPVNPPPPSSSSPLPQLFLSFDISGLDIRGQIPGVLQIPLWAQRSAALLNSAQLPLGKLDFSGSAHLQIGIFSSFLDSLLQPFVLEVLKLSDCSGITGTLTYPFRRTLANLTAIDISRTKLVLSQPQPQLVAEMRRLPLVSLIADSATVPSVPFAPWGLTTLSLRNSGVSGSFREQLCDEASNNVTSSSSSSSGNSNNNSSNKNKIRSLCSLVTVDLSDNPKISDTLDDWHLNRTSFFWPSLRFLTLRNTSITTSGQSQHTFNWLYNSTSNAHNLQLAHLDLSQCPKLRGLISLRHPAQESCFLPQLQLVNFSGSSGIGSFNIAADFRGIVPFLSPATMAEYQRCQYGNMTWDLRGTGLQYVVSDDETATSGRAVITLIGGIDVLVDPLQTQSLTITPGGLGTISKLNARAVALAAEPTCATVLSTASGARLSVQFFPMDESCLDLVARQNSGSTNGGGFMTSLRDCATLPSSPSRLGYIFEPNQTDVPLTTDRECRFPSAWWLAQPSNDNDNVSRSFMFAGSLAAFAAPCMVKLAEKQRPEMKQVLSPSTSSASSATLGPTHRDDTANPTAFSVSVVNQSDVTLQVATTPAATGANSNNAVVFTFSFTPQQCTITRLKPSATPINQGFCLVLQSTTSYMLSIESTFITVLQTTTGISPEENACALKQTPVLLRSDGSIFPFSVLNKNKLVSCLPMRPTFGGDIAACAARTSREQQAASGGGGGGGSENSNGNNNQNEKSSGKDLWDEIACKTANGQYIFSSQWCVSSWRSVSACDPLPENPKSRPGVPEPIVSFSGWPRDLFEGPARAVGWRPCDDSYNDEASTFDYLLGKAATTTRTYANPNGFFLLGKCFPLSRMFPVSTKLLEKAQAGSIMSRCENVSHCSALHSSTEEEPATAAPATATTATTTAVSTTTMMTTTTLISNGTTTTITVTSNTGAGSGSDNNGGDNTPAPPTPAPVAKKQQLNCSQFGGRMSLFSMCLAFQEYDILNSPEILLFSFDGSRIPSDACPVNASARRLSEALARGTMNTWVEAHFSSPDAENPSGKILFFDCTPDDDDKARAAGNNATSMLTTTTTTTMSPSSFSSSSSSLIQRKPNTLLFELPNGDCFGGIRPRVWPCLMYIEPQVHAIPYVIMILSSLKDILFITVGLFVMDKQWVRQKTSTIISRTLAKVLPFKRGERAAWADRFRQRINPRRVDEQEFAQCFVTLSKFYVETRRIAEEEEERLRTEQEEEEKKNKKNNSTASLPQMDSDADHHRSEAAAAAGGAISNAAKSAMSFASSLPMAFSTARLRMALAEGRHVSTRHFRHGYNSQENSASNFSQATGSNSKSKFTLRNLLSRGGAQNDDDEEEDDNDRSEPLLVATGGNSKSVAKLRQDLAQEESKELGQARDDGWDVIDEDEDDLYNDSAVVSASPGGAAAAAKSKNNNNKGSAASAASSSSTTAANAKNINKAPSSVSSSSAHSSPLGPDVSWQTRLLRAASNMVRRTLGSAEARAAAANGTAAPPKKMKVLSMSASTPAVASNGQQQQSRANVAAAASPSASPLKSTAALAGRSSPTTATATSPVRATLPSASSPSPAAVVDTGVDANFTHSMISSGGVSMKTVLDDDKKKQQSKQQTGNSPPQQHDDDDDDDGNQQLELKNDDDDPMTRVESGGNRSGLNVAALQDHERRQREIERMQATEEHVKGYQPPPILANKDDGPADEARYSPAAASGEIDPSGGGDGANRERRGESSSSGGGPSFGVSAPILPAGSSDDMSRKNNNNDDDDQQDEDGIIRNNALGVASLPEGATAHKSRRHSNTHAHFEEEITELDDTLYRLFCRYVCREQTVLLSNPSNEEVQRAASALLWAWHANGDESLLWGERYPTPEEDHFVERIKKAGLFEDVLLSGEAVARRFIPQVWMLCLQLFYAFVYLIILFFVVPPRIPSDSSWVVYQAIYFQYVNSATSVSVVINALLRRFYRGGIGLDFFSSVSLVLLLPVLITHIIPGFFVYLWVPVITLVTLAGVVVFVELFTKFWVLAARESLFFARHENKMRWILNAGLRVAVTVGVSVVLQALFNYMVLFYQRDSLHLSYGDIPIYEWSSRSLRCAMISFARSLANALQLISAFA